MAEKEYSLDEALRLVGIGILVYKSLENGGAKRGLRFEAGSGRGVHGDCDGSLCGGGRGADGPADGAYGGR